MKVIIDNLSGMPIYDQIVVQIKEQIINGSLSEDEALPSIRNLAKDLRISVITTKRAYEELEKDGLIYTVAGKGCFVRKQSLEMLRESVRKKIEEHLFEAVSLSRQCGMTLEELIEILRFETEEEL